MIWGSASAVPGLGFGATHLLGALLALVAVRFLPRMRPWPTALVVVVLALLVPLAARAVPFTFTNGTVADANQVNVNFAAVSTTTVRVGIGNFGITVPSGSAWVFLGPSIQFTTTASQRITGTVTASWTFGATPPSAYIYDALCYRVAGSSAAPAPFAGTPDTYTSTVGGTTTVTAADTLVPGAGTWEVGRCMQNQSGATSTVYTTAGWFQLRG